MNATPRRVKYHPDPPPAGGARDFVVVDDSGEFTYHRSEPELLTAFEYVEEARCIIDRGGTEYRLSRDSNGDLVLGRAFGPVEFHWLRAAWAAAQRAHVEVHRLRRFYPGTRDRLLRDLFESLALEDNAGPAAGPWTLEIAGISSLLHGLHDVDRMLSRQLGIELAYVLDPFGRRYRPLRHRRHWYQTAAAGSVLYVEVHPHGGVLRAGED